MDTNESGTLGTGTLGTGTGTLGTGTGTLGTGGDSQPGMIPDDVPPAPPAQPLADFLLNLEDYSPTVS